MALMVRDVCVVLLMVGMKQLQTVLYIVLSQCELGCRVYVILCELWNSTIMEP